MQSVPSVSNVKHVQNRRVNFLKPCFKTHPSTLGKGRAYLFCFSLNFRVFYSPFWVQEGFRNEPEPFGFGSPTQPCHMWTMFLRVKYYLNQWGHSSRYNNLGKSPMSVVRSGTQCPPRLWPRWCHCLVACGDSASRMMSRMMAELPASASHARSERLGRVG